MTCVQFCRLFACYNAPCSVSLCVFRSRIRIDQSLGDPLSLFYRPQPPTCNLIPADTHNQQILADVQVIVLDPVFRYNLFASDLLRNFCIHILLYHRSTTCNRTRSIICINFRYHDHHNVVRSFGQLFWRSTFADWPRAFKRVLCDATSGLYVRSFLPNTRT